MRPALSDYDHLASGKVREIYRVDDDHLLLVASDRISAYDYVLDSTIPDKGRILTAMSVFFFGLVDSPNHLAGPPDDERIPDEDWIDDWENRSPAAPVHGHWYRFVPTSTFDDPWVDACRSVVLADTLGWPAVCQLHPRNSFMAPSIDLSCAFHRARAHEPWLYAEVTAESAANGLVGCASRVWGRDGTLLAVGASQLLCRPMPSP